MGCGKSLQAEGTASAKVLRWIRKKKLLGYGTGGGWSGGRNQAAWGFMAVPRAFPKSSWTWLKGLKSREGQKYNGCRSSL